MTKEPIKIENLEIKIDNVIKNETTGEIIKVNLKEISIVNAKAETTAPKIIERMKEKFKLYEGIRESGLTNMFDIKVVTDLSGNRLSQEDCLDIMEHYAEYKAEFNDKKI
jgi:hypothetical protein